MDDSTPAPDAPAARERWFTDDELVDMGRRTLDGLKEAIRSGDADRAEKLAERMYNEFLSQHDGYRNWVTSLLSEIGRRWPADLEQIMLDTVRAWWVPNLEFMDKRNAPRRARAKMFIAGLRGHLQPIEITEDDEAIRIAMTPCGSGGRLILEGKYEGPDGFLEVREPSTMTYGRSDLPVYCAHEAAMEIIDIDRSGSPLVVVDVADDLGHDPCAYVIYKDPERVPQRYFDRVGRTGEGQRVRIRQRTEQGATS